ncbi:uncharacterized protein METZ01_LOCUS329163, partial [marine metagenome]
MPNRLMAITAAAAVALPALLVA